MKLNAKDASLTVLEPHDESLIGPGSLIERFGQIGINNQRVIADHLDALWDPLK